MNVDVLNRSGGNIVVLKEHISVPCQSTKRHGRLFVL